MNVSAPQYHSPTIRYDPLAEVVIVQRVNPDTGQVTSQTPDEKTLVHDRIEALGGSSGAAAEPAKSEPSQATTIRHAAPAEPAAQPSQSAAPGSVSLLA
jgi:hypothetical protein